MSIPKPFQWALETLFPAGALPWSAQACKLAPAGDVFTPNTKPAPEEVNYLFNAVGSNLGAVLDGLAASALCNWKASVAPTTLPGTAAAGFIALEFDAYNQRWVADPGGNGSSGNVPTSYDGGSAWFQTGSVKNMTGTGPLAVSSVDGSVISVNLPATGTGFVNYWPGSTMVGVTTNVTALNGCNDGLGAAAYMSGFASPWQVFAGQQVSGVSFVGHWITSTNGTTWVDKTTSLPSGFQGNAFSAGSLLRASSPTALVFAFCGVTAGTDVSRLAVTTDGATSTDVTPTFLTGKVITGFHYSSTDGLFGLLCYDGTSSYLYTTSTPGTSTSWTLCKTFTGRHMVALTSLGRVWVAGLVGQVIVLASNDVASAGVASTWRALSFPAGGFFSSWQPNSLKSSGCQVIAWEAAELLPGHTAALNPASAAY